MRIISTLIYVSLAAVGGYFLGQHKEQKVNEPNFSVQDIKHFQVIDCHLGILAAAHHFNKYLKGKVTKKELDAATAECGSIE